MWVSSKTKLPPQNTPVMAIRKGFGVNFLCYSDRWKKDYCVLRNDPNDWMRNWRGWYDDHDWKVTDDEILWWDGELPEQPGNGWNFKWR